MKHLKRRAATAPSAGAASSQMQARRQLIDAMVDDYVSWREECATVASSYENWNRADAGDAPLAFSAYRAALDREDHAAARYERMVQRIALG